jgi:hypothetical protein
MSEVSPETPKSTPESNSKEKPISIRIESLTIQEDVKEGEAEDEEGLPIYPYEGLKVNSPDPVTEIDVTKREVKYKQLDNTFLQAFIVDFVLRYFCSIACRLTSQQQNLGRNLGWRRMLSISCPNGNRTSSKWPFNCSESPSCLSFSFSSLLRGLPVEKLACESVKVVPVQ